MVAPPVHEATATVAPSVKEATEIVTRPAKEVTEAVKPPVKVLVPTDTSGSSSAGAAKTAGGVVREATEMATHTAKDAIGAVITDATRSDRSSAGRDGTEGAYKGAANDAVASHEPGNSNATVGVADGIFVVPPSDGSVRAPLPKWMAFVWPAIALIWPAQADLLGRWEQGSLRPVFGTGTGPGVGPVVAGVHASGGRPEAADSSSSPFSKIPSALGHAFRPGVPASALAYLFLVTLAVIAVAAAVRREILGGRRQGPGP
jgi:hypothetical protein